MIIFNMTNIITFAMLLAAIILFIFLSHEIKKAPLAVIPLFAFVLDLVIHTIQVMTLKPEFEMFRSTLYINIIIDYAFILVLFISYLWADDVESKDKNKKSISNCLDWLWKKV